MLTLVVDMMGSDKGAKVLLGGVKTFLEDKNFSDAKLILVGKKEELEELANNERIEIVDAREVISMEAGAFEALRAKNSSMFQAVSLLKENNYNAVVSAGSTGAFISLATVKMKLIEGIERAALISPFPSKSGKQVAVLDIGANNENTAYHLFQFAKMGRIYSQVVMGVETPNIYLLSNGAEEKKGSPEVKEAHKLIKESGLEGFKGNIEGRDALQSDVDVLVTGGFAGNVFLKTNEGMAKIMSSLIKDAFKRNIFSKLGYLLAGKGFNEMKQRMDYKSFGGAMLLGINGIAVKAHGSSDEFSFYSALKVAYRMSKQDIVNKIKKEVNNDEVIS